MLGRFKELIATLQQLKDFELGVGPDGRHRAEMLSPFGADTARNTPSRFIFSMAKWFRSLITPEPGTAILYSDFSGQEVYVAAALSKDPNLLAAVCSGDPYLWFLKAIGRVQRDATRETHREARNQIKPILLGGNYGQTPIGAAVRLGVPYAEAAALVDQHRKLFSVYWDWIEAKVQTAFDDGEIRSRWGWRMHVGAGTKPRSVQNHPIQCMGAHILQFAITSLTERGVRVCCPVHDAIVTECSVDEIDEHREEVQLAMKLASKVALGIEIPVDTEVFAHGARYVHRDGVPMFNKVIKILREIDDGNGG